MKKLWQNNLFKLPVFLLLIGVICTAALAIVNYFTASTIVINEKNAVLNAIKSSFNNHDDYETFEIEEVEYDEKLELLGITAKDIVKDSSSNVIGYVYVGTVQGFADKISFVASYENNMFHKLKVTYEQESNKKGIKYIVANYVDYDLSATNFFETSEYATGVAGASMTGKKGLIEALNACSSDYLASISN
jgi:hypothetical protein